VSGTHLSRFHRTSHTNPKGKIVLIEDLGYLHTAIGRITVCETENPYPDTNKWQRAYVALACQPTDRYPGPEVAMIVTVVDGTRIPIDFHERFEGKLDPNKRTIDNVFRHRLFRATDAPEKPAVTVGKFLLGRGFFNSHSNSRTLKGSEWALLVGGLIPPNSDPIPSSSAITRNSELALQKLQDNDWWHALCTRNCT
jgi:hypothetical protein